MASYYRAAPDRTSRIPDEFVEFPYCPLLAHSQAVRNAIDIVEPACDQVDLQNGLIAEADGAQPLQVAWCDGGGMARQLGGVVEHRPVGGVER